VLDWDGERDTFLGLLAWGRRTDLILDNWYNNNNNNNNK
jgi:hypothetical protein